MPAPAAPIQVDVWSDIVCPWCAIGRARLRKAADRAGVPLRFVHHAFELRPDLTHARPTLEVLAEKYGGPARAREMTQRVRQLAALDGLDLRTDEATSCNTFDAHRLVAWAQSLGKGDEMVERVTAAHFTELRDVSDHAVLRTAAVAVGLDGDEADKVLASGRFADDVRADEGQARAIGVTGVPFFVLEGRLGVSGAQPVDVFQQALAQAAAPGELADAP